MPFDLNSIENISILDELSLWSAPFGLSLLDTVRMHSVRKVLDVGSGLGFPSLELALRYGKSTEVVALDPWETAAARAKWKAEIYGLTNYQVVTGVAEQIPFPDGTFDVIVSNNGLNNVEDMLRSLQECRRVATDGAQLVFTMNTETTMNEFYTVFRTVLMRRKMDVERIKLEQHIHAKRKPLSEVDALLATSGWKIIQKKTDKFCFRYANGSAMFAHFFIKLAFMEPWQEIVPETVRQEIFEEIEQELNRISVQETEFKMTIPFVTYECAPSQQTI